MHIAVHAAIEWWTASGERTAARLDALVEHYLTVNGITEPVRVAAEQQAARDATLARFYIKA